MTWCKCVPCMYTKKSGKTAEVHKPQVNTTKSCETTQKTITKHDAMKHDQNKNTNNAQIHNAATQTWRSRAEVAQKARRNRGEVAHTTTRHQNAHILKLHTENRQETCHIKAQKTSKISDMNNEQTHITHKTRNKRARTSVSPRQDTYQSRSVVTSTLSTAALQVSQRPSANASAISSSVSASIAFAVGFSKLVVSNHSGSFKATANAAFKVSSSAGSVSSATHLCDTFVAANCNGIDIHDQISTNS